MKKKQNLNEEDHTTKVVGIRKDYMTMNKRETQFQRNYKQKKQAAREIHKNCKEGKNINNPIIQEWW